jgi:hypothetical protein
MRKFRFATLGLAILIIAASLSAKGQEATQEMPAGAIITAAADTVAAPAAANDTQTYSPWSSRGLLAPSQLLNARKGLQQLAAECAPRCSNGLTFCPNGNWCCPAGHFFCPGNPEGQRCVPGGSPSLCKGTKVGCCPGPGNTCSNGCT